MTTVYLLVSQNIPSQNLKPKVRKLFCQLTIHFSRHFVYCVNHWLMSLEHLLIIELLNIFDVFRTTLKEMYDLMVENKEIPSMKTFEIASHTFGTANILNHLTIFDRLFEEYQSNLIFRRDVRNNNRKV